MTMDQVSVIKLNPEHQETWRYNGHILKQDGQQVLLEAFFNRKDLPFHGIVLREGDRFIEAYFSDRWYNIFEIYDREDQRLKAWYCNVTLPAEIHENSIAYVDLALDLLVFPDGRQLVLDEDEFAELDIDDKTHAGALQGLDELKLYFASLPEGFSFLKNCL